MACALTQGYLTDCKDNIGGAREIHFIEFDNIESLTVTADVVTDIVLATGKRFWRYRPARETAYGKFTVVANPQNTSLSFTHEVGLVVNKLQTNTSMELTKLAQNLLAAVVTDANGRHWLYGRTNGLDVTGGEGGTGTAQADRNGTTFTFTGGEPFMPIEVDADTFAILETPGA